MKWDAENRLVGMHTGDLASPQANDKWLQFKYDYMGRRVEKTYQVYSGGWQVQSGYPIRFVYDGWNPVLVLKSDNSTKRKLTWGLDLSGTIHGAGGIGGLLAVVETQGTEVETDDDRYWFFYDANGNVGQIMDADNLSGDPAARYEYDPYGSVISSSGPYKDANPFRFSTKWFDDETGLGYWGYRYYSPRLGRWISRDPIGDLGGLNLHTFIGNKPTWQADPLGLSELDESDYVAEANRIIDGGEHDPDIIFQKLVQKYLSADPENDWFWDCQDDMEELFDALGDVLATNFRGQIPGSPTESAAAKRFRKVRNWVESVEYIPGTITLRKATSPTNPSGKYSYRMDAVMHFFGQGAVAANIGETGARVVGNLVEVTDEIKSWVRSGMGYDIDDLAWGILGGWLENAFDTNECDCRKLAKKFANGSYTPSRPIWFENPDIYR